ncbi:penicillin-binding transpeptidase domain-containing protein [Streptomonospora wellingtoniae]|uniref:Penicillin-binding transpeptidase domain-containing protein n=1 Tax=Streptomonospora wellingtoniae TaxID=3075544 RepID=A0ABU2KX89_9ACTN|nr:penicillin-binding transpeptidase domain-containing protein [Streptomonospora sp. DSM 45055]MDT0303917.1 penicillin-binding transpeptidase domain-containing protein [Streptomonospora sp. DSM 45055]
MEDDRRPPGPGGPSSPSSQPGWHGGHANSPEPGAEASPEAPRPYSPQADPPDADQPDAGQADRWRPAAPANPYSIPARDQGAASSDAPGNAHGAGQGTPPPGSGDPYAHPGGPHHSAPPPGDTPAGPTGGAVFARGGASDGQPPPPPPGVDSAFAAGTPDPGEAPRRSRKGLVIGVVSTLVVLALVGGAASWYVLTMPEPEDAVTAYAGAWRSQDYAAMAEVSTGGDPAAALKRVAEGLGVEGVEVTTGQVQEDGDSASVPFDAVLDLSNAGEWSYSGELPLVRADREWKVDFSPAVVHPKLGEGQTLVRTNQWGERGRILAADGTRLDDGSASGSVQMIVGEVGTAAKENLADLGPAYQVGDPVGLSGVQQTYEERLAGKASTAIRVVDSGTAPADVPEDAPTVGTLGGSDGKDVTLSLDPAIQAAAAQAIVGQSKPTAMAVVRPSTGEVLAAANVPGGFNRALDGQYPAGSIFKIISYNALLDSGMGMDAQMSCPKTVDVAGRTYKNAGDAAYGAQTVTEAFATSCNTALVQEVANRLDGASLLKSAEQFGFNTGFHSGVPVFKPSLPQPDSTSLLTASSIGQGQVLTSPLHLATLPAAVADGSWRSPMLVTEPAPAKRPEPRPIGNADRLRDMTRAVVTQGTAKNVGFTGEVHGKSGTAEYGTAEEGEELPAHGWFVGYEGDIAFAVVVEDGESGSGAAAPLAKSFLDAL